jgi:hypothetical protein
MSICLRSSLYWDCQVPIVRWRRHATWCLRGHVLLCRRYVLSKNSYLRLAHLWLSGARMAIRSKRWRLLLLLLNPNRLLLTLLLLRCATWLLNWRRHSSVSVGCCCCSRSSSPSWSCLRLKQCLRRRLMLPILAWSLVSNIPLNRECALWLPLYLRSFLGLAIQEAEGSSALT